MFPLWFRSKEDFIQEQTVSPWNIQGDLVGKSTVRFPQGTYLPPAKTSSIRSAPKRQLVNCGHTIDAGAFPSINCQLCWNAFFYVNMDMTKTNIKVLNEGRVLEIQHVHGKKYVKRLLRFVADVLLAYEEAKKEGIDVGEL